VEGYVTKRGVLSQQCCSALRHDALERLATQNDAKPWSPVWWHYQAVRFGLAAPSENVVRVYHSPRSRHIVLPSETSALCEALYAMADAGRASGLPEDSALVELCVAITLPGASAQTQHSDISPARPNVDGSAPPLVTCWAALQDVAADMGPTQVYPRTHTRFRARQQDLEATEEIEALRVYRAFGEAAPGPPVTLGDLHMLDENPVAAAEVRRRAHEADEAAMARERTEFGDMAPPTALLMSRGDASLMDCRVVHCGSAYPRVHDGRASPARALLNVTWATAGHGKAIKGFTYHRMAASKPRTIGSILRDGCAGSLAGSG
jgi:hypothetical protein